MGEPSSVSTAACLRAKEWWYFAALPAAGLTRETVAPRAVFALAIGVAAASACLGFAYGHNAVHDARLDRSRSKNPLAGARSIPRAARVLVGACATCALSLAIARGDRGALAATLASLAFSYVYSAPPRLKAVPFVGTLLNVGIFLPLFWLGPGDATVPPVLVVLFAALLLQNQLLHEREDLEEDLAGGVVTTVAVIGVGGLRWAVTLVAAAALLALAALASGPALAAGATGLALATAVALGPTPARRRHRNAAALAGAFCYLVAAWGPS